MSTLTLDQLREANERRLPQFKNSRGEPAHVELDGSDWTVSDWFMAVTGELGEAANLAKKVRRGDVSMDDARPMLAHELADVVTYLDILAKQIGVDLGAAVIEKFNIVSARVGSDVHLGVAGPVPTKMDTNDQDLDWFRAALKASEAAHQETRAELDRVRAEQHDELRSRMRAYDEIPQRMFRQKDKPEHTMRRFALAFHDAERDRDDYRDERNELRRQLEAITAERAGTEAALSTTPEHTTEKIGLPPWATWESSETIWRLLDSRGLGDRPIADINVSESHIIWRVWSPDPYRHVAGWSSDSLQAAMDDVFCAVDWDAWKTANEAW